MSQTGRALVNLAASVVAGRGGTKEALQIAQNAAKYLKEYREFIAIGQNAWGRGFSEKQAMDSMVLGGGKRSKYLLYSCPMGTTVNPIDGTLEYPNGCEAMGIDAPREVRRRGIPKVKK